MQSKKRKATQSRNSGHTKSNQVIFEEMLQKLLDLADLLKDEEKMEALKLFKSACGIILKRLNIPEVGTCKLQYTSDERKDTNCAISKEAATLNTPADLTCDKSPKDTASGKTSEDNLVLAEEAETSTEDKHTAAEPYADTKTQNCSTDAKIDTGETVSQKASLTDVSASELTAANNLLALSPYVHADNTTEDTESLAADEMDVGNVIHLAIQQADGTVQDITYEIVYPANEETTLQVSDTDTQTENIENDTTELEQFTTQKSPASAVKESSAFGTTMNTRGSWKRKRLATKQLDEEPYCDSESDKIKDKDGRSSVSDTDKLKPKPKGRPKTGNVPPPVLNEKGEQVYVCKTCGASVKTHHALLVHERRHTGARPYQCQLCQKTFTTKGNMVYHLNNTHSSNKPWQCDTCHKGFKDKKILKIHQRIHTGERPYVCSICEMSFTQINSLKSHQLIHDSSKPHLCDICGSEFRTASNMKIHKMRHLKQKNHGCEYCDKAFVSKVALQKHHISHTGERNYSCDVCTKTFAYVTSLKHHVLAHHTVHKEYVCSLCTATFTDLLHYTRHKNTHAIEAATAGASITPQSQSCINSAEINLPVLANTNQSAENSVNTVYHPAEDKYLATPIAKQQTTDATSEEQQMCVHVLVNDEAVEGGDYENYHSLLISAAMNAELALDQQDGTKQFYQVLCSSSSNADGNTHQVAMETEISDLTVVEGHIQGETLVEGHVQSETLVEGHVQSETVVECHVQSETVRGTFNI